MIKTINIRKGYDIKLIGESELAYTINESSSTFAVKPPDFNLVKPKLLVREGHKVKAGTPVFFDKENEKVLFASPVSGEIKAINRGEKRILLEIVIASDSKMEYEEFKKADPDSLSKEEIVENLLKSGVWPLIRQRPFDKIANPEDPPKAIFISTFDSAPLAPDNNFIIEGKGEEFQTGINALKKLTEGVIHLNIRNNEDVSKVFTDAKNVQINRFKGVHPAGNVGVQIHNIDPINKDEVVWFCHPQDVLTIGRLFLEGRYNAERIINLCGSEVKDRKYHKTYIGANIETFVKNNIIQENVRYISGNILTGTKVVNDGFLSFYDSQITVITEGDNYEFFGWALPGFKKFSLSRTFASSWLSPKKKRAIDTNLHGGERAFIMSGQYEKYFPMSIYPVHLLKSIIVNDVDMMEKLGIYEVAPEDFALCEVACTSKIEAQDIVRKGLDSLYKEFN